MTTKAIPPWSPLLLNHSHPLISSSPPHPHPHPLVHILIIAFTSSPPHSHPHHRIHILTTSSTSSPPHSHPHHRIHILITSPTIRGWGRNSNLPYNKVSLDSYHIGLHSGIEHCVQQVLTFCTVPSPNEGVVRGSTITGLDTVSIVYFTAHIGM